MSDPGGSNSSKSSPSTDEGSLDALMRDFDQFGTTPPRTARISRRSRKHKEKRSSMRHAYKFAQFCQRSLLHYSSPVSVRSAESSPKRRGSCDMKKRSNKRNLQRRRDCERDLKLDLGDECDSEMPPEGVGDTVHATIKVESSNRFLSLSCKLVKAAGQWRRSVTQAEFPRDRTKFYDAVAALVKTGSSDPKDKNCRRQLSREETLWQTELKDVIWLELQAWKAMRTPSEQDQYLCEARQSTHQLLHDILTYRFQKKNYQLSVQSRDSGIHFPFAEVEDSEMTSVCSEECSGCFWLFCPTCMENENAALHQVEMLLSRLELAEALYPSSRAFAALNPLYMSSEFKARVKAMCSWYNITRAHRLKLLILGRQLLSYAEGNDILTSSSSSDSLDRYMDGSTVSTTDVYNFQPITTMGKYLSKLDKGSRNYRRFIEDVLKMKGLRKALYFLEKVHLTVLRKAKIALENPKKKDDGEDDEERECRRYGIWSYEAQALNLPSFIPAFLFISRIPLDVIHEFLRMRLETKPENPSVLSIRQLIRELKEGMKLAVLNRNRYLRHVDIALSREDRETQEKFKNSISEFDSNLTAVLELYLNYLHQWVIITQNEKIQKNVLEEEWNFILDSAPQIPLGESLAGGAFCKIASNLVLNIRRDFSEQVTNITKEISLTSNDTSVRQSVLIATRGLQTLCQDIRDRTHRVIILAKMLNKRLGHDVFLACPMISESVGNLKSEALALCQTLRESIACIHNAAKVATLDELDRVTLQSRFREVLHQFYKFGFEYYRDMHRLASDAVQTGLTLEAVEFGRDWLKFVTNYCERGRGLRPRWAHHGLEFLLWLLNPENTQCLTDQQFESLKADVEQGVGHILGTASACLNVSTTPTYMSTRTRSSSPRPTPTTPRSSVTTPPDPAFVNGDSTPPFVPEFPDFNSIKTRQGRILKAIKKLDSDLDNKRKQMDLIGNIVATPTSLVERKLIKPRPVTFTWQRGIKIGQGRFGKVYTAVNNDTGELMAMKEISMTPNDARIIQSVALELKIIEGLNHPNLVRYYGTEIHRDELLIFMELCTEGTLESLVESTEGGLPEGLVRRYSHQLVSAISALHQHSIVHRDIKTANIFLTNEGNCLKIGDFGSAVKIKAHTTVPGELRGFVGTQAYMAPEVFMNSNTDGHGRAADIWSLGCVIIEMASGKRPWHQFDSNYQIMFKVGMGETPDLPGSLSEEGADFVSLCLCHNPKERATTSQLAQHDFLKVDMEEESVSFNSSSVLEDYLKLGVKR